MTPEFVTGYMTEAMKVAMFLAGPVLCFGLVSGLLVSIFQAVTQINEMTLVFIPKMAAVGVALLLFFPWSLWRITQRKIRLPRKARPRGFRLG